MVGDYALGGDASEGFEARARSAMAVVGLLVTEHFHVGHADGAIDVRWTNSSPRHRGARWSLAARSCWPSSPWLGRAMRSSLLTLTWTSPPWRRRSRRARRARPAAARACPSRSASASLTSPAPRRSSRRSSALGQAWTWRSRVRSAPRAARRRQFKSPAEPSRGSGPAGACAGAVTDSGRSAACVKHRTVARGSRSPLSRSSCTVAAVTSQGGVDGVSMLYPRPATAPGVYTNSRDVQHLLGEVPATALEDLPDAQRRRAVLGA